MTNWDNSTISFILQTGKWMKAKEPEDFLPEGISLIRKLTGAYTTLQIIFEDERTARIKNAMPLFLDDFIFDPAPIKSFLEANDFEPVYWKNITEQNHLFSDILLALSSAVLIPVVSNNHYRLIIIGWSEPQSFNSTFQNFIIVVKNRLEELLQNVELYHTLYKNNDRYKAIFQGLPQAIVFIDDKEEAGWVNTKAAELLQLAKEDSYEPGVVATAMSELRNKTLLVSCTPISTKEINGKLWIFEER